MTTRQAFNSWTFEQDGVTKCEAHYDPTLDTVIFPKLAAESFLIPDNPTDTTSYGAVTMGEGILPITVGPFTAGVIAAAEVEYDYTKIADVVTLHLHAWYNATDKNGADAPIVIGPLPQAIRPTNDISGEGLVPQHNMREFPVVVVNLDAGVAGTMEIKANGVISFFVGISTAFDKDDTGANTVAGFRAIHVTYKSHIAPPP